MIQVNELRIGNWLVRKDRQSSKFISYEQVNEIKKGIKYGELPSSYCEAILITPEILEKCGYNYLNGRKDGELTFDILNYEFDFVDGSIVTKSRYEPYYHRRKTDIKYLHQLQNLYFALTGEELKVTL